MARISVIGFVTALIPFLAACKFASDSREVVAKSPAEALREEGIVWNGIILRVRPVKENPALGEPVEVHVELENSGTLDVIVSPMVLEAFQVVGPDGTWTPGIDISRQMGGGRNNILKPGETARAPYALDLERYFLFDAPGKYHVRHTGAWLRLKDLADVFFSFEIPGEEEEEPHVSSEWITIDVGPGIPTPRAQVTRRLLAVAPEDWRVAVIKPYESPPEFVDGEITWNGYRDKVGVRISLRIGDRKPLPNETLLCDGPWGPVRVRIRNNPESIWPDYETRIREALSRR